MATQTLKPRFAPLSFWRKIMEGKDTLALDASAWPAVDASRAAIERVLQSDRAVYGVNTGFGKLANTRVANDGLRLLQRNLVLSHAAGVGEALPDTIVRLVLALKISSLARGHSGVRRVIIERLLDLVNNNVLPEIPAQGSVGASGDL